MADIIPQGYAQVLIPMRHSGLARSAAVTFGIDMNAQFGNVALVDKIVDDFVDTFGAGIANEVLIGPGRLTEGIDGGENLAWQGTFSANGASAAEKAPANVALLLTKATSRGGRRGRGRMYIPWYISEANVTEVGTLSGGEVTAVNTAAANFLTRLAASVGGVGGTPMVLLHSESDPDTENPTAPGLPNAVTSLTASSIVGTQRRRLGR